MPLKKKEQPVVRHDDLAAELADASHHHNEVVSAARARLLEVKASVVDRAQARFDAIRDIQAELDREAHLLGQLIDGTNR